MLRRPLRATILEDKVPIQVFLRAMAAKLRLVVTCNKCPKDKASKLTRPA